MTVKSYSCKYIRRDFMYCNLEHDILSVYPYNSENIQELICRMYSEIQELKKNGQVVDGQLIANLEKTVKNFVTLEELGAKGDGRTDDLEAFKEAKKLLDKGVVRKVVGNGTYAVSNTIELSSKNEIEYELGCIVPTNSFPQNGSLLKAGDDNGSQSGMNFKAVCIDGKKKFISGLNITSCSGSTFDIGTIMGCLNAGIRIDNPTQISSDNLLKGNVIRQCGFGIILRSETKSACEGTMVKYNFIYDNNYAGILLADGSHYSDIHSMTDFNGKYTVIVDVEGKNCWRRGDAVTIGSRHFSVIESFGQRVYLGGGENYSNIDLNNQYITCSAGTSTRITKTVPCKPLTNSYLDIINTNGKHGFSKNTIISTYCGGIEGDRLAISTDFLLFGNTSTNERNNVGGISTRMNPQSVDVLDFYAGKKIMSFNHEDKISLNGNEIYSRVVGNKISRAQGKKPMANYETDKVSPGSYLVCITPTERNSEFAYTGILYYDGTKSSLHHIKEHNLTVTTDGKILSAELSQDVELTVKTTFLKIG